MTLKSTLNYLSSTFENVGLSADWSCDCWQLTPHTVAYHDDIDDALYITTYIDCPDTCERYTQVTLLSTDIAEQTIRQLHATDWLVECRPQIIETLSIQNASAIVALLHVKLDGQKFADAAANHGFVMDS